jgi:hypothetical protein
MLRSPKSRTGNAPVLALHRTHRSPYPASHRSHTDRTYHESERVSTGAYPYDDGDDTPTRFRNESDRRFAVAFFGSPFNDSSYASNA